MQDVVADGGKMRVFTLVDVHTRECLALEVGRQFRGVDVAAMPSAGIADRGAPRVIQCDQGTEFTSIALDQWAYWNKVQLDFSRRGRPGDNAVCEASDAKSTHPVTTPQPRGSSGASGQPPLDGA